MGKITGVPQNDWKDYKYILHKKECRDSFGLHYKIARISKTTGITKLDGKDYKDYRNGTKGLQGLRELHERMS